MKESTVASTWEWPQEGWVGNRSVQCAKVGHPNADSVLLTSSCNTTWTPVLKIYSQDDE